MTATLKLLLFATTCSTLLPGCVRWGTEVEVEEEEEQVSQAPQYAPPSLQIDVADWPPVGPLASVMVTASGEAEPLTLEMGFTNEHTFSLSGTQDDIELTGEALGEGYGTLWLSVTDADGQGTRGRVNDLLVDLTPPELFLGENIIRRAPDSVVEFWMGDAWILGGVSVHSNGQTQTREFEAGFPATLGETWDYSLIEFPSEAFAEGDQTLTFEAWDAAGNRMELEAEFRFDGTPPEVEILAPQVGAMLSGPFALTVAAVDPGGPVVWFEAFVGGTPVGTGVGPNATIELDAADLTPGEVEIEVIATDQAGNVGFSQVVPVTILAS